MEAQDRNDKTLDQKRQHSVDDSIQIANTPASSEIEERSHRIDTQEQIVPILEEDYSISKQISIREAKIEKRVVTKTKTVKVPLSYEELYINDKKLKSVEESQILSALKDKISSIASTASADTSVEQSVKKKNRIEHRGELVSLFSSDDINSNQGDNEKIITLYEEQFEIVKKVAKVAEIVITKRRVTEKKKIDIDLRREEVKIKYPDGRSEKLT